MIKNETILKIPIMSAFKYKKRLKSLFFIVTNSLN